MNLHRTTAIALLLMTQLVGCARSDASNGAASASTALSSANAASSQSAAAPAAALAKGVPSPASRVEKVVNPKREKAYSGPTGSVAGSVVITGDEAPEKEEWLKAIPKDCLAARETYKSLFREGLMRSVADVFVAV